ncbi:hypothetical protein [Methyloceanibacter sp.]|uniref:hypothetical protein n=1 Tax=Methyloceanibacter sp. TaxID=1965321 RepID=UPI002B967134|nr:hypothetical protein [Methyloceanibacter sp.]HML93568.1 hypothetical protein [Methyloceanibacter sp.]
MISYGARLTVVTAILVVAVVPAFAEFEIQESTIDPGEVQLQYRGAWHSGLPASEEVAAIDLLPDIEEAPLRQSHDFEIQYSLTTFWLVALTHTFDEPVDDEFRLNAIELETQFELITREGDGLGLSIQGGTEQPVFDSRDEADPSIAFGPIVELSKSNYTLVLNPLFFRNIGHKNDQDGFGFEYGWQGRRELFGERLWLAVEMFGEIEDMSNAGAFSEQEHSIGPAFYYTFGKDDDILGDAADNGYEKSKELTVSLGAQFGLTDATSDFALKVFIGYEFD